MRSENSLDKRKKLIAFASVLLVTAGIASVIVSTVWQKEEIPATEKTTDIKQMEVIPDHYNLLVADNELLTGRLRSLQSLDEKYAGLLTSTTDKKLLDSVNRQIYVQEEIFRGSIDSISLNQPSQIDAGAKELLENIVASYKLILQNRQSVSSLRNTINLNKNGLKPDEMAMLKNQNDLQEKNNRIASLESALKVMSANKTTILPKPAETTGGEDLSALKENISQQESKVLALTALSNSLKQDNEKLMKQQADAAKNAGSGETVYKNKAAGLQQRIDELNAELSLAQVDCNLSRVDAAKIISNSRQRKELLSEASSILTNLAQSDDAEIRRKVQDKIVRLNQVAANSRD